MKIESVLSNINEYRGNLDLDDYVNLFGDNTYYRFTGSMNPMSDWGHAMFSDDIDVVTSYGAFLHVFDGKLGISIEKLKRDIINQWEDDLKDGYIEDYYEYYSRFSGEEIYKTFNPRNIVDSAEGYDSELVEWLWDRVLEDMNIYAVITMDGAVVFDERLIKTIGNVRG